ncbi:hypothetical protein CHL78_005880 [Romboutsia weinsteinii]|uniref:Nuclease SbcCD subunit C n=1 Tax=Romboutsia weinsteinii TaxID=2020949 RepID=A0A371J6Z3_9FIRM|nr:AAA family ATPase [Romboutsia weinsteinii]RDY28426.1 hypothetical protein CHL78_005880 [Romboutsia weinsteinii]
MGYTINKIIIQNFKVFDRNNKDNTFYEQIISQNLQILTGQNGYGKSSIYDAIELVLTGNISRLYQVSGRSGVKSFKDNLITNNKNDDLIVALELLDDNKKEYLSILKHIPQKKIKFEKESNIGKWFETYISKDRFVLENILNSKNKKSNDEAKKIINELLQIEPEYFYINYIQQQDPISFLKRKEEDRKEIIDKLLQIDNLKSEKYEQIENKIKIYNSKYEQLKEEIISKKKYINNDINNKLSNKPNYKKIFEERNDLDWDLDIEKIDNKNYLEDINGIKLLIKNHKTYKNIKVKDELTKYYESKDIINRISYHLKYGKNIEALKIYREKYKVLKNVKSYINNKEWKLIDKDKYKDHIDINKLDEIRNESNNIENLKNKSNKILIDINKKRSELKNMLSDNDKIKESGIDENRCILCGSKYDDKEHLIKTISNYTNIIEELLGGIEKDIISKSEKINLEIDKIQKELDEKIKLVSFEDIIDDNKYREIIKYIDNSILEPILNKLENLGININEQFDNLEKNNTLEQINNIVYRYIEDKANKIGLSDIDQVILNKSKLDYVYSNYFQENDEKIELININELDEKITYLDYCYNYHIIEKNNIDINTIETLKFNMVKTKFKLEKFEKMKDEYDKCINEYKRGIISKIEIPLYIYTGKILQNLPAGLGVFCQLGADTSDKITRLKFIGNMKTSHDIVNTFSSGQLAGFIISFTLAMKKVYNNQLDVILIDDPVQTMDELNLISFTEILRNEFSDKQVIMSTHENNIAGYINYKYSKYNLDSSIIDVRNEFN